MSNLSAALMSASGFLALLAGLLCGAPLGSAINRSAQEERIRAWRVAHSSLVGGGVMLLAIAANLSRVALSPALTLLASSLLCVSVASFTFALVFGAWKGYRGTAPDASAGPAMTYYANMTGVILSMASILMFTWGACAHLLRLLPVR